MITEITDNDFQNTISGINEDKQYNEYIDMNLENGQTYQGF